jgi:hypothetical protein
MLRRLSAALATLVVFAVFVAAASASGPAPPGKDIITISCAGVGTFDVSVPHSESNNGAGQVVGDNGHGIPVTLTFTLFDVTTNTTVFSDSGAVGGGKAHPNQETTTCSGIFFEGPASEFFGSDLPPGVAATDIVRASFSGDIVIKL